MVHSTDAGWLPAVEFTDRFKTTVEPGLPEPALRLTATPCAKQQEERANATKKRNVPGTEDRLSMATKILVGLVKCDYTTR